MKDGDPEVLYRIANFDLYKRLSTLKNELNHIKNVANFYKSSREVSGLSDEMTEIYSNCEKLEKNLKSIIEDYDKYQKYTLTDYMGKNSIEAGSDETIKTIRHYEIIIFQSHFRERAKLIARTIGLLTHKIEQILETCQLEDPSPILRRSIEQGFVEEYIKLLSIFTLYDLNKFLTKIGVKKTLPYKNLQSAMHSWTYDDEHFVEYFRGKNTTKNPDLFRKTLLNEEKKLTPDNDDSFNIFVMSFWWVDNSALHSIAGHEAAHILIHDLTRDLKAEIIGFKCELGEFGQLCRNLTNLFSSWLPNTEFSKLRLDIEVLSDILATCKFGVAHANAWFLENLGSSYESSFLKDEYDNFISLDNYIVLNENENSSKDNKKPKKKSLYDLISPFKPNYSNMAAYLRGRVICSTLEEIGDLDSLEKEYIYSLKSHLNNILNLRLNLVDNNRHNTIWRKLGDELSRAIKKSNIGYNAWLYFKKPRNQSASKDKENEILNIQLLSETSKEIIFEKLEDDKRDDKKIKNISYYANDIPWRYTFSKALKNDNTTYTKTKEFYKELASNLSFLDHICQADLIFNSMFMGYEYLPNAFLEKNEIGKTNDKREEIKKINKNILSFNSEEHKDSKNQIRKLRAKFSSFIKNNYNKHDLNFKSNILQKETYLLDLALYSKPSHASLSCSLEFNNEEKKGNFINAITYGRYDRLFLIKEISSLSIPHYKHTGPNLGKEEVISYKTRKRFLRPLKIENTSGDWSHFETLYNQEEKPLAAILIDLIHKGFRHYFAMYILPKIKNGCNAFTWFIFASGGHEDFVLLLYPNKGNKNDNPSIKKIYSISEELLKNFLVDRTDTIIVRNDTYQKNLASNKNFYQDVYASINIRISNNPTYKVNFIYEVNPLIKKFKERLISFSKDENIIHLFHTFGRSDYSIHVNTAIDCECKFKAFHELRREIAKIENVSRINTQLSVKEI
ncbi:hypothetical protein [Marinibactrum halimedae]|nr:hypothetical protein [Marinibactrum halimedae]MCD9458054.1 hypothetical protein [Marinibactrum halimedae]